MSDAVKQETEELERAGSGTTAPVTNGTTAASKNVPKIAYAICSYHAAILVASLAITTFVIGPDHLVTCAQADGALPGQTVASPGCRFAHHSLLVFAFLFGMLGSALSASRIVVLAIRHRNYQREK